MKKRFIVAVDNAAHPQRELRQERFIGYAKGKGLTWWNRMPSFWLLVDNSGQLTASQLDDDAYDIFGVPCAVIELRGESHTWSGHGPKGMFDWLNSHWNSSSSSVPLSDVLRRLADNPLPPFSPPPHKPGS